MKSVELRSALYCLNASISTLPWIILALARSRKVYRCGAVDDCSKSIMRLPVVGWQAGGASGLEGRGLFGGAGDDVGGGTGFWEPAPAKSPMRIGATKTRRMM